MLRRIIAHLVVAATKYPTLSLLLLFAFAVVLPLFTPLFENLKTSLGSPLAAAEALDPFARPDADQQKLRARYEQSRQEHAAALLEIARLQRELAQVSAIAATRRQHDPVPEAVPARVLIGGDVGEWRRSLLLNRGSANGVQVGDPVVCGRVLVGRLAAVGPFCSRVQLVTDPGFFGAKVLVLPDIDAWAASTGDGTALDALPRGLVRGSGDRDFSLDLDHIPLDATIAVGDLVFTSPHSVTVPGGLIVGRLAAISRSERKQFASVRVDPWLDFEGLTQVQIIRWPRTLPPATAD